MAAIIPPPGDTERRILPFRPRQAPPVADPSPVADLKKYETTEGDDDYRHRMVVNALASFVTVLLVIGGIWIANSMAQLRNDQDCVLSGRRACAPIGLANHQP